MPPRPSPGCCMIDLRGVRCGYGAREVLRGLDCRFAAGEFVSIAGPNGAGKSTLLSLIAGLRDGFTGECLVAEKPLASWSRREFARIVSFVPQSVRIEFPFTARQVVLMGRAPHTGWAGESPDDATHADDAMQRTDSLEFARRDFRSLSGGEKQRVLLAAAVAQAGRILVLDEPATFLDIEHQRLIYRLLRDLAASGVLVLAATHDLNLAAAYSSRVLLLKEGVIAGDGAPATVFSAQLLQDVFHVPAVIEQRDGRTWVRHVD
ncbi:MAG: ABC transporter ATP-binding protein [Acidobacteria bacterium]|nr:ABC transporter ATP-binding protein [Acidobacteriota bacterium]